MKIAAYLRVSTDRQAKHNDSLDSQLLRIKEWAKQRGGEIVKVYNDPGNSAFRGRRPVFEQMLNDVKAGECGYEAVVVYSISRFSRTEKERLIADGSMENAGVKFYSYSEPLPDDPDLAWLVKGIIGNVNEHQSRQNSKTVSHRLNDTASKGYHTGSKPPYGYKSIIAPETLGGIEKHILVINKEEAELVRKIFELAKKGLYGKSYGVKTIATILNQQGILRRNAKWTANSIHRMLTETAYYGERVFGKNRTRKDPGNHKIIIPVPVIIERKQFDNVRVILKARAPDKKEIKGLRSPSLLTGLLKCSKCGCNLVVQTGKSGQYEYYKCSKRVREDIDCCNCPNIRKDLLEEEILNFIGGEILNEECISKMMDELKEKIKESGKADQNKLRSLHRSLAALELKLATLYDNIGEGQLECDDFLLEHIERLNRQRSSKIETIGELKQKSSLPIKKFGTKQIKIFVAASQKILLGGNNEATKAYLQAIVEKIIVGPEKKAKIQGGKLKLIKSISSFVPCHPFEGVPRIITNWR